MQHPQETVSKLRGSQDSLIEIIILSNLKLIVINWCLLKSMTQCTRIEMLLFDVQYYGTQHRLFVKTNLHSTLSLKVCPSVLPLLTSRLSGSLSCTFIPDPHLSPRPLSSPLVPLILKIQCCSSIITTLE